MKKQYEVSLDVELMNSPEVQELIKSRTFSSTMNEMLAEWVSTGSIRENSVIAGLKEQLRRQNQLIEHLTAVCERIYKASVYSATMDYENNSAEACNRVLDTTKSDYMNRISDNDVDESYLHPKSLAAGFGRAGMFTQDLVEDEIGLSNRRESAKRFTQREINRPARPDPVGRDDASTRRNEFPNRFVRNPNVNPVEMKPEVTEEIEVKDPDPKQTAAPKTAKLADLLNLPNPSINGKTDK